MATSARPLLVGDFPQPQDSSKWPTDNNSSASDRPTSSLVHSRHIWRGYLYGQLANVSKAALWWSTFGINAVSMLNSDIALAVTRAPFNVALLFTSPLAVVAAERLSIRDLLIVTTGGRFIVWSFLIPLTWIGFSNLVCWPKTLWTLMISFMFIDGIQVAFSNAVDIDCGGLDCLSSAYELPLTDFLRYKFTTIHQLVFDCSFIFLTPPIILLIMCCSVKLLETTDSASLWYKLRHLLPTQLLGSDPSVFVLCLGIALVFGLLSLISLRFYVKYIPSSLKPENDAPRSLCTTTASSLTHHHTSEGGSLPAISSGGAASGTVSGTVSTGTGAGDPALPHHMAIPLDVNPNMNNPGLWPELALSSRPVLDSSWRGIGVAYREKIEEVIDGLILVGQDPALKWRLVMLAFETALEDSMVSVIIPMMALNCISFLGQTSDKAVAALVSVVVIAVGKFGGVLAGVHLASLWHTHTVKSSQRLFTLVLLSSLALVLLPWGYYAAQMAAERRLQVLRDGLLTSDAPEIVITDRLVEGSWNSLNMTWAQHLMQMLVSAWQWLLAPPLMFGCGSILLGVFLFFVFSTAPKIGFASLIQNLVIQEDQAVKVFGFVGMFVTVVDGLMITLINSVFWYLGRTHFVAALWTIVAFYIAHGLLDFTLGPKLIGQRHTLYS